MKRITPHAPVTTLASGHFDRGDRYYAWRPDGVADWLLIFTVAGQGRFGYPGGERRSRPGDVMLLRPGAPHDYGAAPGARWELLWTHFQPREAWLPWLNWPTLAPGLMGLSLRPPARRRVRRRLREMHRLATGPALRRDDLALNALEEALLWCDEENPAGRAAMVDPRVRAAMEWCLANLRARHTVASLARAARLSPSRFAHLFREQTRLTPMQFVEQHRLARAARLLQSTALSVKQIAYDVGFSSPFYFSLRFHRQRGVSPRRFRSRSP